MSYLTCSATNCWLTPLHLASTVGNIQLVKLFLEHGATVDREESSGKHAFVFATLYGHQEVSRLLAHHLWLKQKNDAGKARRTYEKYMEELRKEIKHEETLTSLDRKDSAEAAYREWHLKNNLVYKPTTFGQVGYDRNSTRLVSGKCMSRNTTIDTITKCRRTTENTLNRTMRPDEVFHKTNDRSVSFLPLSDFYKI